MDHIFMSLAMFYICQGIKVIAQPLGLQKPNLW